MSVEPPDQNVVSGSSTEGKQKEQLKKIRKMITKLIKQRNGRIGEIKRQTIRKYIPINRKAQEIIEGGQIESEKIVKSDEAVAIQSQYNSQSQQQEDCKKFKEDRNQGIPDYWKNILLITYQHSILPADLQLFSHIKEISVKQYSKQKITMIFSFRLGHSLIPQGKYQKTIIFNEKGKPQRYVGDFVPNVKLIPVSLSQILLKPTRSKQKLKAILQFFQIASTELIPKSLIYYLQSKIAPEDPAEGQQQQQQIEQNLSNNNSQQE